MSLNKTTTENLNIFSSDTFAPLITVITAVYNAEEYINQCILSILTQTYKNFEYLIIDGGSTDDTVSIIEQYSDQIAYFISEPDKGIYDAWNKGLSIAKGEWIAFVGADDLLYPNALEIYVQHIAQHPKREKLEFVSSKIELVDLNASLIRSVGEEWVWRRFRKGMITGHVGCFHSKRLFNKYGVFDSSYKISGDYELLLRPKDQLVTSFINQPTVKMRMGGVSSTNLYQAIDETYRAKISNGIISPIRGRLLRIVDRVRVFTRGVIGYDD